jgi:hypothetical protein
LYLSAEPATFADRVFVPGQAYLASLPAGMQPNFKNHAYWRSILREMHSSYGGVCAFTCHFVPLDTGSDTVEHFLPKKTHPELAYTWSNYRFACGRLNGRKGLKQIVDPFEIVQGQFEIDFPSLMLSVGPHCPADQVSLSEDTIEILGLNDERCIGSRQDHVMAYCKSETTFEYLAGKAPFLASELVRLGLSDSIKQIMIERRSYPPLGI